MKIICSQESLLHGIQTVQKGISSRIGLPIYNGILFEANEDNKVHLFATDFEIKPVSISSLLPGSNCCLAKEIYLWGVTGRSWHMVYESYFFNAIRDTNYYSLSAN